MRNMYARIYNQRTWFVELRLIFAPYEKSRARVPVPLLCCLYLYLYFNFKNGDVTFRYTH
jgi:hypothetical protein